MVEEQKSERVQLLMTPTEVKAVDDWSFGNRVRGRSEAIRRLIELGLKADPKAVTAEEVAARLIKENDPATAHLIEEIARELKD